MNPDYVLAQTAHSGRERKRLPACDVGAFLGTEACSFQSSFLQNSLPLAFLPRGIPTVPGKVTLQKDAQNLIGISIGGGAQYCPCLYIVQV